MRTTCPRAGHPVGSGRAGTSTGTRGRWCCPSSRCSWSWWPIRCSWASTTRSPTPTAPTWLARSGPTRSRRPSAWWACENYIDVFTSSEFWSVLGWTVVWTGVCVFMHYLLGLLSALMLNRPMRGRTVYRILLIIPWAVPAFVSTFAWRFIFNTQYGLLNIALDWVGLGPVRVAGGADPRAVLGDPGQRLDRLPVHDGGPARRHAGHRARALRGGRGRRRDPLAAVLVGDGARACVRSAPR